MNMDEFRIDHHKLAYHPERVARWLKAGDDWAQLKKIYPIYLEISPTGRCNHRCGFCAMDFMEYKSRSLDIDMMRRSVEDFAASGIKSIMFAGEGEPFLYDEIIQLTEITAVAGIDIAFTTNGVLLNERAAVSVIPRATWIKVSMDAGTPETYSKIHGTKPEDFSRVIANLKWAVDFRNRQGAACTIGAQMLLLPETMDEVEILAKICRDEIGLDYLVVKPYSHHPLSKTRKYKKVSYDFCLGKTQEWQTMSGERFKLIYREQTINRCINYSAGVQKCRAVPFFWAYIMSNHDVYACSSFLTDERFYLGNLRRQSFKDIWEGERRREMLQFIRNSFDASACRCNCRMSSINEYLSELVNPSPHVNFI